MPHTNRNKLTPGKTSSGFKPAQFVNINLAPDQIATIKASGWDTHRLDTSLDALLSDGFKCTVRFDNRNQCYAAWLVPPDGHKWAGLILSGRGSTPTKAMKQLLFIHYIVLDRNWDTVQEQSYTEIDD